MRAITQKLKSRRGVSILYALFLFLVCAFVAAATLTAAYNSAARSTLAYKEEQAYLAISSAAELIKDAVENKSIAMEYITHTEEITNEETGETTTITTYSTQLGRAYDGKFAVVGDMAFALFEHEKMGRTKPAALSYDLTFTLDGYPELANVKGTLTVAEDYGVTVLLSNKDGGGNALRIVCNASTGVTGGDTETTTVTWGTVEVTPITVT